MINIPNIIINNYCNLKCPYCFASDFMHNKNHNITEDELYKILNWFQKDISHIQQIGILGGEPTLHNDFYNIINIIKAFCKQYNIQICVFSNGILLDNYLDIFDNICHGLININSPLQIGVDNFNKILNMLNHAAQKKILNTFLSIGYNLYIDNIDNEFIWKIVEQYNISNLRLSVTVPINKTNKDNYYLKIKDSFLIFIKKALNYNITLNLDCNQIPTCYFTNEELQLISQCCQKNYPTFLCHPVVDIDSNFYATPCLGINNFINCNDFETYTQLYYYFLYQVMIPKYLFNNKNLKCQNCNKHKFLKCQGGCLSFSSYNEGKIDEK